MDTREAAELINKDRAMHAAMMQQRLDAMGVAVRIAHYTGDSSFPTEITLIYGTIRAVGPTMDMAVMEFVEQLLQQFGSQALPKGGNNGERG